MSKRKTLEPLPFRGYLLMMGVFAVILVLGYVVASMYAAKGTYFLIGYFPVMAFVFFCFCVVCVFDALYERATHLARQRREAAPKDTKKP